MIMSRTTKVSISLIFSVLVVAVLLIFTDFQVLDPGEYSLNWPLLGLSFGLFVANYVFRTIRFRVFMAGEVAFRGLLGVSLIHGAVNYFFPMKIGELSFPLLSRFFLGRTLLESGAALILCRIMDLLFIVALFLVVMLVWDGMQRILLNLGFNDLKTAWFFLAFFVCGSVIALVVFRERLGQFCRKWSRLSGINKIDLLATIRLAATTLAVWFCILGNFYFLASCLGYQVPLAALVVVSVVMMPLSLIPVQGFANIGIFELAWISGLMMFGFSRGESLEIAVKVHLVLTVQVFMMLGLGSLLIAVDKLGGKYA